MDSVGDNNLKWYDTEEHLQEQKEAIQRVFKKIDCNNANQNAPTSNTKGIFEYSHQGLVHGDYRELFDILDVKGGESGGV